MLLTEDNEKKSESVWESEFYGAYNDAYRCYLHNQSPICFMNNFLEQIAKITDSSTGYIASLCEVDGKLFPNIEAVYRDKSCDDLSLYNSWKLNLDSNSICIKSLLTKNIHFVDDINNIDVYGEPIKPPQYCKSYICVPYKFNDKIIGILGLFRKNNYSRKYENVFKILGNLIANLQNSYFKVKLTHGYSDKRIITYQLLEDILNTVHDGIVIVDNIFDIIHMNAYALQLIDELYQNAIKSDKQSNLLKLFPQLDCLSDGDPTKKIFKNRKVEIVIEDKTIKRNLEFMLNTVVCAGEFYHLVTIHCAIKKESSSAYGMNSKCLIAFLSHELRNPLQSITLANHLVKTGFKSHDVQNLPPKMTNYFDIINKSCLDMKKIINDILDLSRIEANEFAIDMETCSVVDLVDRVIEDSSNEANLKRLTLEHHIANNVPGIIFTDTTRTIQVLTNLVTNAIKYSNTGKIVLKVTCDDISNVIKFSVTDQGAGIKDNELGNLFKTYGQTLTGKGNMNSQGLGLCVSQKIANLLGGKITVKSEYMKGSTFSFYHPIRLEMSSDKYENNATIGELSGNVLLVDDNASNLSLLHTLLEQFNYEYTWVIKIESVNSGDKAIELCKINNYDVIFMDINMPGINGCTTSKIIKANGFNGKIVATTGNILSKNENKELAGGENYNYFDEIVIKPFNDFDLLRVLKKTLIEHN